MTMAPVARPWSSLAPLSPFVADLAGKVTGGAMTRRHLAEWHAARLAERDSLVATRRERAAGAEMHEIGRLAGDRVEVVDMAVDRYDRAQQSYGVGMRRHGEDRPD